MRLFTFVLMLCLVSMPAVSHAYIGPGIGAGTVGIILGFIASIFLALFAIFWYPIKALIKKMKGSKSEAAPVEEAGIEAEAEKTDEA